MQSRFQGLSKILSRICKCCQALPSCTYSCTEGEPGTCSHTVPHVLPTPGPPLAWCRRVSREPVSVQMTTLEESVEQWWILADCVETRYNMACLLTHSLQSLPLTHTDTFGFQGNSSSGDLFRNSCPTNMYKTNIRCTGGTHVDTTCQSCISTCSKGIEGLGWSPPLNPGVCCLHFILHASFSFEPGCVFCLSFFRYCMPLSAFNPGVYLTLHGQSRTIHHIHLRRNRHQEFSGLCTLRLLVSSR
jgi:hypothetical protein